MSRHFLRSSILFLSLLLLAACGGGGGGSTGGGASPATSATVKISINGSLGGKAIAGAGFTLTLPANVSPATENGTVMASVVMSSGTFAGSGVAPIVTYTPTNGTVPGTMQILLTSSTASGVTSTGEVANITLQLANGAAPVATNFTLNSIPVSVIDTSGAVITGMNVSVTGVTLQ